MDNQIAIEVRDLKVHFPGSGPDRMVGAVDGVDLTVERGAFHAIVGESGCGKTTLARAMVGCNLRRPVVYAYWVRIWRPD